MRICARLAVLAGLLVAVAITLVALRTDIHRAGNDLHALFHEKRRLERACSRLELRIARLRSQDRLRARAAALRRPPAETPDAESAGSPSFGEVRPVVDPSSPGRP